MEKPTGVTRSAFSVFAIKKECMKSCLVLLLLLWAISSYGQQPWPVNEKTRSIEFTGIIPWPDTIRTLRQRKACVRRWYHAKLTDVKPEVVALRVAKHYGTLTYDSLPSTVRFEYRKRGLSIILTYSAELIATPAGLAYRLDDFSYGWNEDHSMESVTLEDALTTAGIDPASLVIFRRRTAKALAGW